MTLFTYCIPVDDGAAPNPFWGICTLVICKPVIRRTAQVGDWVVATGSKHAPGGRDFSKSIVYAMRVTDKMSMSEYDVWCQNNLPNKIPDIRNEDWRMRLGDCIYDFAADENPAIRPGVHNEGNRPRDTGGKFALLSNHFYYFGSQPKEMPEDFYPIIRNGQGHRAQSNDVYKESFISWLESEFADQKNKIGASPQLEVVFSNENFAEICTSIRCLAHEEDELEFNQGLCD
jgi:hypothetical protein